MRYVNTAISSNVKGEKLFEYSVKIYFTKEIFPNYINRMSFKMKIGEI